MEMETEAEEEREKAVEEKRAVKECVCEFASARKRIMKTIT